MYLKVFKQYTKLNINLKCEFNKNITVPADFAEIPNFSSTEVIARVFVNSGVSPSSSSVNTEPFDDEGLHVFIHRLDSPDANGI